jgi:hypothetical protein
MLTSVFLGCVSLALPAIWDSNYSPTLAVQLRDGKTYFVQPPTLFGASAYNNRANAWGANYYFTIQTSKNAGEPLQTVAIAQTALL